MEKPSWQCATPGCRRAQLFGDLCAQHAHPKKVKQEPKEIRNAVRPTGETRWAEGQPQTEMTDGRQRWWVGAQEEAA